MLRNTIIDTHDNSLWYVKPYSNSYSTGCDKTQYSSSFWFLSFPAGLIHAAMSSYFGPYFLELKSLMMKEVWKHWQDQKSSIFDCTSWRIISEKCTELIVLHKTLTQYFIFLFKKYKLSIKYWHKIIFVA